MKQSKIRINKLRISEIRTTPNKEEGLIEEFGPEIFFHWQPSYDLYVIDEMVFISIELPGVNSEDIKISIGQNYMTISGIKKPHMVGKKSEQQKVVFHNLEISFGRFFRRIEFPLPVEPRYGDYKLDQGVLKIKLPVLKEHIVPIEED